MTSVPGDSQTKRGIVLTLKVQHGHCLMDGVGVVYEKSSFFRFQHAKYVFLLFILVVDELYADEDINYRMKIK